MLALASLVASVASTARADAVVDVGAGQGHLACALACRHGLSVLALDAVAPLVDAARARAARLAKCATGCSRHGHVTCVAARLAWGTEEGAHQLAELLSDALPGAKRVLLVGLHACGDLTPALLRTFTACETACGVVAVGCCHNLLTEAGHGGERAAAEAILSATATAAGRRAGRGECAPEACIACDAQQQPGYPLSSAAQQHCPVLGRGARMLACQSSARMLAGLGERGAEATQRHAFRAGLEVVLTRFFPEIDTSWFSIGKPGRDESCCDADQGAAFARLCLGALDRAGLGDKARQRGVDAVLLERLWKDELEEHARLVGPFFALRAVLAAPLEALIALDRLLFVFESMGQGGHATVLPVFDPCVSPRNLAVVALKPG